jgi:hypothetical protein
MRRVLNAAVLALTALVLLATSEAAPRIECAGGPLVPGPTQLSVETTCGPPGTVTVNLDPDTCDVTLDGAAAVGLPSSGSTNGTRLSLREGDGARHCECEERAPGEWSVRCYEEHRGGCGGSDLPACEGVLRVAAP